MKITLAATDYVGLATGACLARLGNNVLCLDEAPVKITILKSGGIPIHEPGLKEPVDRNRAVGRQAFAASVSAVISGLSPGAHRRTKTAAPPSSPSTLPMLCWSRAAAIASSMLARAMAAAAFPRTCSCQMCTAGDPASRGVGQQPAELSGGQDCCSLRAKPAGPHFCVMGSGFQAQHRRHGCRARSDNRGRIDALGSPSADQRSRGHGRSPVLPDADALMIAAEWKVYGSPDIAAMRMALRELDIFGGGKPYELAKVRESGLHYERIGRWAWE